MWICKLLGHKLVQPIDIVFCQRCGYDKNMVQEESLKISRGKSQFIEPVSFKQKFDDANTIDDILE